MMHKSILLASLMAAASVAIGPSLASLMDSSEPTVIANDLLQPMITAPAAADQQDQDQNQYITIQNQKPNQKYVNIPPAIYRIRQPLKQQQQKRQSADSEAATRTVINGNHATYVEPPADFKPIIYEQERQPGSPATGNDLQTFDSSPPATSTSNQETSQQQQPLASSVSVSGLSRQQQQQHQYQLAINQNNQLHHHHHHHQQQQQQQPRLPRTDSESGGADPLEADKISFQMDSASDGQDQQDSSATPFKAPIGRWSDWHDMSVEPDLASSDTDSSQATYYFAAPVQQQEQSPLGRRMDHRRPPLASGANVEPINYRTRYGSTKGAVALPRPTPGWQPQQQMFYNQVYIPSGQPINGHYEWRLSVVGQHQQPPPPPSPPSPPQASQFESTATANQRPAIKVDQIDGQLKHLPAQHRSDIKELNSHQPAALSSSSSSSSSSTSSSSFSLAAPAMMMPFNSNNHLHHGQQQQQQPQHETLHRLSNSENLIKMQLVAENQAPLSVAPVVAALLPKLSKEASAKSDHTKNTAGQQQQQQQQQQQSRRLKRRRKSKSSAEVRIQQLALESANLAANRQQVISATSSPAKQVNGLAGGAPVAKLVASSQEQRVFSASSPLQMRVSSTGKQVRKQPASTSSVVKRAVKKRPIRTQQPVGLTSWFLGGVRDLDGRHWQLPADLMNKLAVNDVDLHHEHPPSATSTGPDQQPAQANEVEKATIQPASHSATSTTLKPNVIPR